MYLNTKLTFLLQFAISLQGMKSAWKLVWLKDISPQRIRFIYCLSSCANDKTALPRNVISKPWVFPHTTGLLLKTNQHHVPLWRKTRSLDWIKELNFDERLWMHWMFCPHKSQSGENKGSHPVPFFLFFYKVYKRPLTPPPLVL